MRSVELDAVSRSCEVSSGRAYAAGPRPTADLGWGCGGAARAEARGLGAAVFI